MNKVFIVILALLISCALSYAITIGTIWLVCLCFSIRFKILPATGVWIILYIVKLMWPSYKPK